MEVNQAFQEFLEKKVNLNPNRVEKIKEAQRILPSFIAETDSFKDIYLGNTTQGSYRQKTIIKPKGEAPSFDLDLLILLKKKAGWEPKDYLSKLAEEFKGNGRYSDLTDTKGKTRCVTIDYEGDFHADIVPAILDNGNYYICNKTTNQFELSDGDGYANWFAGQDRIAVSTLVPAVRLIKYLRDHKGDFDTKSIILTTIAGLQISATDAAAGLYSNPASTVATILFRMNEYLGRFNTPPSIANPAMPGENFNRHWKTDHESFSQFKTAIASYAELAQKAQGAATTDLALENWKKLFGDEFETGAKVKVSPSYGSAPFTPSKPWNPDNV